MASGGTAPYSWGWSAAAGSSLPPGLNLASGTGVISGIPTTVGSYSVVLTVADSRSPAAHATVNHTITISAAATLTITSGASPNGVVGIRYGGSHIIQGHQIWGFILSATGGVGTYSWGWTPASGSSLPPGLTVKVLFFGGSTRCCLYVPVISGTPTAAGTYNVIVGVTDSGSPPANASASYTITVSGSGSSVTAHTITSKQSFAQPRTRYSLIDLGTFGGPQSYVNIPDISYAPVLNNSGTVAGWADTLVPDPYPDVCFDGDCLVAHAFQWQHGVRNDLGVLSGGVSSQANWISSNGLIAGISQNGEIDPLVPGFPEFRAVMWRNGQITDLGTLGGGYESIATSVNGRGQVAGFAINTTADPDSMFGLGFQTRAFLWQNGAMQDLGTLGTGTNAMALLMNERGQVAGNSYTSSQPSDTCAQAEVGTLATDAFLWDNGVMTDLGNFGGTCTFAFDLNNRGEVVGGSRLAGDQEQHPFLWNGRKLIDLGTFGGTLGTAIALNDNSDAAGWASYSGDQVFHAALWRNGKITDLGTVEGDSASFAFSINALSQVVGVSVPPGGDFDSAHAFLWDAGLMIDLNTLISGGGSLRLTEPETINDRGEIAGNGFDADGNQHAFLLVPCDEQSTTEGCDEVAADSMPQFNGNANGAVTRRSEFFQQHIPMLRSSRHRSMRGAVPQLVPSRTSVPQ